MTAVLEWPSHFPKSCPPDAAAPVDQAVFRIVAADPPQPADFRSYLELGLREGENECKRAGLSSYGTQAQAERKMAKLSKHAPVARDLFVATAMLIPDDGKLSEAGTRGHRTLWLRAAALARAPEAFEVVQ